jgi:hypothetical protein
MLLIHNNLEEAEFKDKKAVLETSWQQVTRPAGSHTYLPAVSTSQA